VGEGVDVEAITEGAAMHDLKDTESFDAWAKEEFHDESLEEGEWHKKRLHKKRTHEDGTPLSEKFERLLGCGEEAGKRGSGA